MRIAYPLAGPLFALIGRLRGYGDIILLKADLGKSEVS